MSVDFEKHTPRRLVRSNVLHHLGYIATVDQVAPRWALLEMIGLTGRTLPFGLELSD